MGKKSTHSSKVVATIRSNSAAAQSAISASWRRSMINHGLDPARTSKHLRVDGNALKERRAALDYFRYIASRELDQLSHLVGAAGGGVFLTDLDGVILDQRCKAADQEDFQGWGLSEGSVWSEEAEGTNGIGTALAENRYVVIHRDEHFKSDNTALSCVGTPIYGHLGQTIGALDVSSAREDHTQALNMMVVGLVRASARRIEATYFKGQYKNARIIVAHENSKYGQALLAVDENDLIIGANRAARLFFNLGLTKHLRPKPATDLFHIGETGRNVAERAELIRALARANGNVSKAAKDLRLARATIYRRMAALNIRNDKAKLSQYCDNSSN